MQEESRGFLASFVDTPSGPSLQRGLHSRWSSLLPLRENNSIQPVAWSLVTAESKFL